MDIPLGSNEGFFFGGVFKVYIGTLSCDSWEGCLR